MEDDLGLTPEKKIGSFNFDVNNTKILFVSSMRVVWREASNASMKLRVHHLKARETTQSRSNY